MTIHPFPNPQTTFDEWWALLPKVLRRGGRLARGLWHDITNGGLHTRNLDKDSGRYRDVFLQATPEEIIEGTKECLKSYETPDGYHDDIKYEHRAAAFLNRGRWEDFL